MAQFIKEILRAQSDTCLDIATAFFNIKAYELVKEEIKGVKHFRLLLGKSIELNNDRTLGDVLLEQIREEVENFDLEKSHEELVKDLIEFLKRDNVEVKIYTKDFLHGKAYIFDKIVVIGSSNFTQAGLTSNTELNAVSLEAEAEYVKKKWFDKFWEQAQDFKDKLIEILEQSRFGTKEYTPYQIFIKALYELQKEDLKFDEEEDEEKLKDEFVKTRVNLAEFQEDAVRRVFSRLRKYGAVLVADSVGLGKTWIAKKVIEEFGFYKRKNFLIICPAQIREMWTKEIKDLRLPPNILSQEELALEDYEKRALKVCGGSFKEVSLVVVDESHNFRNPLSNRWENLFNLLEKIAQANKTKPYILFMTATPINNTLWDLYWQIMLMMYSDKTAFVKEGIDDLFKFFKKVEEKQNPALLNDLLNEISIRRTRDYIKRNYPQAEINGIPIKFPERVLENVEYKLDDAYQGMYKEISDTITQKLTMAYYRVLKYKKQEKLSSDEEMALGRMIALEGIFKTILLKRLESSVEAFRKTVANHVKFLTKLKEYLKDGKLLRKEIFNKYVVQLNEESTEEIVEKLDSINLDEFDMDRLLGDIQRDIDLLNQILEKVNTITPEKDAKLLKFKEMLYKLVQKGQVVVFTYYADTLEYLANHLIQDERFKNISIESICGKISSAAREEIVNKFFNKEIQILLSTDVLSEGMNLQTAQFLINYDLHWNPTRMIQRAGRIDRIGSSFDKIYIWNFFPEEELEDLLRLVQILQEKIIKIDASIGLDQTILGETVHPKVFGTIRRIKEKDVSIFEELEAEVFGGGEKFFQPLRDFLKTKAKREIENLPYGIYSGLKKGKIKGIFFYYKYGEEYHFWFLCDLISKKILRSKTEIFDFICCDENEERVIPDFFNEIYEVNKILIKEIEEFYKQTEQRKIDAPTRLFYHDRSSRFIITLIHEIESEIDCYLMEFPEDKYFLKMWEEVKSKIWNVRLTKRRLKLLRKLWKEYKSSHKNWKRLIKDIHSFFEKILSYKDEPFKPFDKNKLKLVCIDFIS